MSVIDINKYRKPPPAADTNAGRLKRIKASLEKINQLMQELKERPKLDMVQELEKTK